MRPNEVAQEIKRETRGSPLSTCCGQRDTQTHGGLNMGLGHLRVFTQLSSTHVTRSKLSWGSLSAPRDYGWGFSSLKGGSTWVGLWPGSHARQHESSGVREPGGHPADVATVGQGPGWCLS